MKIITRYMMRSLVPNYLVGLSFFTVLMLINQIFIMVKYVVERGADVSQVSRLFVFSFPMIFSLTIPMAVVMASVLTFGKMSMDSEIVALRGSGISLMRIVRPNLFFGLALFVFALLFFDTVLPWGNTQYAKVRTRIFVKDPMASFGARQVAQIGGKSMRYESEDRKTKQLYNIYITSPDGSITFAKRGEFFDKRIVQGKMLIRFRLYEVSVQERDPKMKDQLLITYAPELVQTFFHSMQGQRHFFKSARNMTISELVKKLSRGSATRKRSINRERANLKRNEKQYQTALKAFNEYKKKHPKEFAQPKIKRSKPKKARLGAKRRIATPRHRRKSKYGSRFRRRAPPKVRRRVVRKRKTARLRRPVRRVNRPRYRKGIAKKRGLLKKPAKDGVYHSQMVAKYATAIRNTKNRIRRLKKIRYNSPYDIYELHKKFSLPFACFIFTLIGAPLGMFSRRSGKSVGLGFSILVVIVYYFCLVFGKSWVLSNKMGPELAAWLPDLFLGILGVVLVIKKLKE